MRCLSHGRKEPDCKDCREEVAGELLRLIRETKTGETDLRGILTFAYDVVMEYTGKK